MTVFFEPHSICPLLAGTKMLDSLAASSNIVGLLGRRELHRDRKKKRGKRTRKRIKYGEQDDSSGFE